MMKLRLRLYPGDPNGAEKPTRQRDPKKLDTFSVFWRDIQDKNKGTIWIYHSLDLENLGGFKGDPDIPFAQTGHRLSLIKARGKKWTSIYPNEDNHNFLASPMATKNILAAIVLRWPNPPLQLKPEKGPAFCLKDLRDEILSYVYLVELLTFYPDKNGHKYYKIGKAKSIPKRIKQFGPCKLISSIELTSEQQSFEIEARIQSKLNHLRRPDTEIFFMSGRDLESAVVEFSRQQDNHAKQTPSN